MKSSEAGRPTTRKAPPSSIPFGALLLLFSFYWFGQARALCYYVQGSFVYQVYTIDANGKEAEEKPLVRHFDVVVEGCTWKVKVVLVGNTAFDHFLYFYDGTNLIHYAVLAGPHSGQVAGFTVETSAVPRSVTTAAGEYPWLALCSSCYFGALTNSTAPSLDDLKSGSGFFRRYEVPCRFTLYPDPPHLPTDIQYSAVASYSLTQDGRIVTNALRPPFRESGYTKAQFTSRGFTNVGGLALPTEFEYRKYKPQHGAKSTNDLRCTVRINGTITNVANAPVDSKSDFGEKRFLVHDLRFPEPDVTYVLRSNSPLPAMDTLDIQKARALASKRFEQRKKLRVQKAGPVRLTYVATFIAIFALPLIYYSFRRRRGGEKETKLQVQ